MIPLTITDFPNGEIGGTQTITMYLNPSHIVSLYPRVKRNGSYIKAVNNASYYPAESPEEIMALIAKEGLL